MKTAENNLEMFTQELQGVNSGLKKFQNIINQFNDAIFAIDPQTGRLLDINDKASENLGYSRKELLAMKVKNIQIIISDDHAWQELVKEIRKKGSIFIQGEHKRKDGTVFPVEVNAKFAEEGTDKYIVAIAHNITKRKRNEEKLRLSEERYNLAIQATSDGIWDWNIVTNEEYYSSRWCEIIGYSYDDPDLPHTYDSWASRIHPDDYDRVMNAVKAHLKKGMVYDVDYRHRYKSGEYRWQNSRGQAIFDEDGKPIRMVGCIRDITERKKMEELLKNSKSELEKKNIALNEVIGQVEIEKQYIKENVTENVVKVLLPILKRVKLKGESKKYVGLLENHLKDLVSSYGKKISLKGRNLAPRELEICNMIKEGMTSKEIARLLSISSMTVDTHRKIIRKKMGISNKPINLTSYLNDG